MGSHDPSRSNDLGNVNWQLSWNHRDSAKVREFSGYAGYLGNIEIERKRANFEPCGFTTYKITTFVKFKFCGSHDLGNVNWPLSRKPLEIEQNGAYFRPIRVYYL